MIKTLFVFFITIFTVNYAFADEVSPDISRGGSWASGLEDGPIKHFSYSFTGEVCVTGKGLATDKNYTACTTTPNALLFVFTSYTQNKKVRVNIGQKGSNPIYISSMYTLD